MSVEPGYEPPLVETEMIKYLSKIIIGCNCVETQDTLKTSLNTKFQVLHYHSAICSIRQRDHSRSVSGSGGEIMIRSE